MTIYIFFVSKINDKLNLKEKRKENKNKKTYQKNPLTQKNKPTIEGHELKKINIEEYETRRKNMNTYKKKINK